MFCPFCPEYKGFSSQYGSSLYPTNDHDIDCRNCKLYNSGNGGECVILTGVKALAKINMKLDDLIVK